MHIYSTAENMLGNETILVSLDEDILVSSLYLLLICMDDSVIHYVL